MDFSKNAGKLTAVGVIVLVVSLLITLTSIEATFNRIWRVPTARPKFGRLVVYWTVMTFGALLAADKSCDLRALLRAVDLSDRTPAAMAGALAAQRAAPSSSNS